MVESFRISYFNLQCNALHHYTASRFPRWSPPQHELKIGLMNVLPEVRSHPSHTVYLVTPSGCPTQGRSGWQVLFIR